MRKLQGKKIPGHVLWHIWAALLMAIVFYFLVLQFCPIRPAQGVTGPEKNHVRKIALLSCCQLAISFAIWHAVILRSARDKDPGQRSRVFPGCLVSWALAEAVAIYGLVLGFQGASIYDYGGFLLSGFSALIYLIPNFESSAR